MYVLETNQEFVSFTENIVSNTYFSQSGSSGVVELD